MLAIFSLKSGLIIRTHHTHSIRCEPTFRGLSAPGKGHFLGRGDILGYAQAYSRSTYSKLFAWGQRIAMRPLANIDVATLIIIHVFLISKRTSAFPLVVLPARTGGKNQRTHYIGGCDYYRVAERAIDI